VKQANNKSDPMAKCGLIPKKKIKIGVINDPPPTPVSPTTKPTKKPANTKAKSCIGVTLGESLYISKYFVVGLLYEFMNIKRVFKFESSV
jgi:hypothetical protein